MFRGGATTSRPRSAPFDTCDAYTPISHRESVNQSRELPSLSQTICMVSFGSAVAVAEIGTS